MFELELERTVGERGGKRTRIFTPPPPSLSLFLTFDRPLSRNFFLSLTIRCHQSQRWRPQFSLRKYLLAKITPALRLGLGGGGGGGDRYDNLIYSGYFHKSLEISDYLFTYLLLKIYFHLKYYLKLWRLNLVSVNEDACLRSIGKSLQNRAPPYEKLLLG